MNNNDIITNLSMVIGALNQIDVKGKQNMKNLFGSIDVLEAIVKKLQQEDASKETK